MIVAELYELGLDGSAHLVSRDTDLTDVGYRWEGEAPAEPFGVLRQVAAFKVGLDDLVSTLFTLRASSTFRDHPPNTDLKEVGNNSH